jgi:hypothetical protein
MYEGDFDLLIGVGNPSTAAHVRSSRAWVVVFQAASPSMYSSRSE